jgi:hypothetical protein
VSSPILPPLEFNATPVPPAGYGLYAAATLIETGETRRHLGGVNIWPYNCDEGFGTYAADLCSTDEPEVKAPEDRPAPANFPPLVVWAADECATDQTEAEVMARARQTLALHEQWLVEAVLAGRMLTDAGAPTVVPTLAAGIGLLEEFLGDSGYVGYIHAARRWAVQAGDLSAAGGTGPLLRTNLGNKWVFGSGYSSSLGDTLVATGPLYVWRDTPSETVVTTGSSITAAHNNNVYAMTERVVVAGYECATFAVTIDPTP